MSDQNQQRPDIGVALMTELLTKLGAVIEQSSTNRELLIEIRDLLADDIEAKRKLAITIDELSGRMEVLSVAASICADVSDSNGKKSVSLSDFCHAITEAEREIFPDDEEDDGESGDDNDDDDGDGDVEVGGRGRARKN